MYSQNYRRRKTCLCNCLKSHILVHHSSHSTCQMVTNTPEICTAVVLSQFSVILRKLESVNAGLNSI